MLAVIKTGGKQYIVQPKKRLKIEKLEIEVGKSVTFDEVLLVLKDKKLQIGKPLVSGAKVTGKIIAHDRAKKVIIFKYKPKKRQRTKNGHRQSFTVVEIEEIVTK